MTAARLLVLGASGMLGRAVVAAGIARGLRVDAPGRGELDVTDEAAVAERFERARPTYAVNCAAYTRVDDCERERDRAEAVNALAVRGIATAAERSDAILVQVSTDYVFDGRAQSPYDESAPTAPLSTYGRTKLGGERFALECGRSLVVRTSWLFGAGGPNFVKTIVEQARNGAALRVVDDQLGAPTYTGYLAEALLDLVRLAADGGLSLPAIVHYRNAPPVSWFGFAREILGVWRLAVPLRPVPTSEFPRPAVRPPYSVLDVRRAEGLLGRPVESWRDGLVAYRDAETETTAALQRGER